MKKFISLVLVFVMIFCLAACGGKTEQSSTTTTAPATSTPSTQPAATQQEKPYEFQKQDLLAAFGYTTGSPEAVIMEEMAAELNERTNGQVSMQFMFNSEGYSTDQRIPAILSGDLALIPGQGCADLARYYERLNVFAAPYVFNNKDHMLNFWHSKDGQALIDEVAAATGLRLMDFVVTGTRCISLDEDKKISCRADLSKYVIRMMTADAWQVMGYALGAGGVVPLAATELYVGCQTGTIDGQDNPLPNVLTYALQEVQESITLTNHYVYDQPFIISEEFWQAQDPEFKEVFSDVIAECCDKINAYNDEKTEKAFTTIADAGVTIYELTNDEINAYRNEVLDWYKTDEKGKAFYDTWDMDLYNLAMSYQ